MLITAGLKVLGTVASAAKVVAGTVASAAKAVVGTVSAVATGLSEVVTAEMMSGVLDEVVALLPVCIPVMIGFIALRKGISFISAILHSA